MISSCGSEKLRTGTFFPSLLERRRRVDQRLFAVVMEAYLHGTSTRKVDDLVKALGADTRISKSEVSRICADLAVAVAAFRDRSLAEQSFRRPGTRSTSRTFNTSESAATNVCGPGRVSGPERLDLAVEVPGPHADLRLRRDSHRFNESVHPSGRHPEQVTRRHHRGEGLFGAFAPLQQPLREIGALTQFRDRHVDCAGPGVEVAVPIAVTGVRPVGRPFPIVGAPDRLPVLGVIIRRRLP